MAKGKVPQKGRKSFSKDFHISKAEVKRRIKEVGGQVRRLIKSSKVTNEDMKRRVTI